MDLSAAPQLTAEIADALARSAALVVLCSNSATDPMRWVDREIAAYRRLRPGGRIFAVIVRDEPPGCFPRELLKARESDAHAPEASEPLAADMRAEGDGPRDAVVKLAAGLLGIDFDLLRRRRAEAQRRRRRILAAVAAAYALTITGALVAVVRSSLQLLESRRAAIASQAKNATASGRPDTAMLLAATAMPPRETLFEQTAPNAETQGIRALLLNRLEKVVPVGSVRFAVFDSSRKRAFVAAYGDPLQAIELEGYRPTQQWRAPGDGVQALALDQQRGRLALTNGEGQAVVVNAADGAEILRSDPAGAGGRSIAFSPRGDRLVVGNQDGIARVFDLGRKQWISRSPLHNHFVSGVAFSSDGERVLSGSYGGTLIEWNARTGALIRTFSNLGSVSGVQSILQGTVWVTHYVLRNSIFLHSNAGSSEDRELSLPDPAVDVAASPQGEFLVAATWSGKSADVIEISSGRVLARLMHPDWVHTAAFYDGDARIITVSRDNRLRVFRNPALDPPKVVHQAQWPGRTAVAWHPHGGQLLATGNNHSLATIDIAAKKSSIVAYDACASPATDSCVAQTLSISKAGDKALIGTASGLLGLLDLTTQRLLWSRRFERQEVLSAVFHPDGKRLAYTLSHGRLEFSSVETGDVVASDRIQAQQVYGAALAFAPSGSSLAQTDSTGIIIRAQDGGKVREWRKGGTPISIAWSPDGQLIAVGTFEGDVRLFDPEGNARRILRSHRSSVTALSFAPNSRFLLSTSGKEQIVWDLASGEETLSIDPQGRMPSSGAFSPDGRQIAVSDTHGLIRVLDFAPPTENVRRHLCAGTAEGQREFSREQMIEFSFLNSHEANPCAIPSLLTWGWARQVFLDWLDGFSDTVSRLGRLTSPARM
jgi:WD40 repeat protein